MRKRSKYRSKPIVVNPIAYAIAGARPVDDEKRLKVKAWRDMTLIAYAEGRAVERDLAILEGALALARELALDGIGIELLNICDRAKPVLTAQHERLQRIATTVEGLQAMRDLAEWHDLQRTSVDRSTYERAIQRTANRIRSGHPANKVVA
jgi:hypothetical protein